MQKHRNSGCKGWKPKIWYEHSFSIVFDHKKIFFFEFKKKFAHFFHFFREKNPTFFRNLKNIGIFKNKKMTFFELENFEFKNLLIIFFRKIFDFQKKSKFSKTFFEK